MRQVFQCAEVSSDARYRPTAKNIVSFVFICSGLATATAAAAEVVTDGVVMKQGDLSSMSTCITVALTSGSAKRRTPRQLSWIAPHYKMIPSLLPSFILMSFATLSGC